MDLPKPKAPTYSPAYEWQPQTLATARYEGIQFACIADECEVQFQLVFQVQLALKSVDAHERSEQATRQQREIDKQIALAEQLRQSETHSLPASSGSLTFKSTARVLKTYCVSIGPQLAALHSHSLIALQGDQTHRAQVKGAQERSFQVVQCGWPNRGLGGAESAFFSNLCCGHDDAGLDVG